MSSQTSTSWPAILSQRDPLPRNMSYMVRLAQLSPCFGLKDRPESWLDSRFSNTITSFSGAERAGDSHRVSTILRAQQDPDSTFDFHHLFIGSRPWKEATDPLIVHAYIYAVPKPAARRCRQAVLSAMEWLSEPRQIKSLTPGNTRIWRIDLDVDPDTRNATLRAFARPVRDDVLVREVVFKSSESKDREPA
jgi:hypothetical protein